MIYTCISYKLVDRLNINSGNNVIHAVVCLVTASQVMYVNPLNTNIHSLPDRRQNQAYKHSLHCCISKLYEVTKKKTHVAKVEAKSV